MAMKDKIPTRRATALAAVLCPALLVGQADLGERVKRALEKSRPVLLHKLARAHGGELALICLAAVHDEVPPDHKVFAKAIRRLSRSKLGRTYDLSLRMMVQSECRSYPDRKIDAINDKKSLLGNIYRRGGFGYSQRDNRWDLSNTQYAALGLRAAVSLGAKVKDSVWRGMLEAAISSQGEEGGFGYTTGGRRPTSSMTVAGITVLQVCADHLPDKVVDELEVEHRLDDAWEWMVNHKGDVGSAKIKNSFYFHYGLERACILSEVTDIDGKVWYAAGAEMLLKRQLGRGGWHSQVDMIHGGKDRDGSDSVSTSFAILFLRRKFQKTLRVGPITPSGGLPVNMLTKQSTEKQIAGAIESAVARGRQSLPQVLRALRSPLSVQRAAGAKALIRITGKDFGFNPHQSLERSRDAVKKAELWWLKSRK